MDEKSNGGTAPETTVNDEMKMGQKLQCYRCKGRSLRSWLMDPLFSGVPWPYGQKNPPSFAKGHIVKCEECKLAEDWEVNWTTE
jgi:hypothetical protein